MCFISTRSPIAFDFIPLKQVVQRWMVTLADRVHFTFFSVLFGVLTHMIFVFANEEWQFGKHVIYPCSL